MRQHFYSCIAAFALSVAALTGCGGGGGGAAPAAAGGSSSNAGITGISGQAETIMSFAMDGLDAGLYGLPKGGVVASGRESIAAASTHPLPTCSSGSVTVTSVAASESRIVYNNCVTSGSTVNGTINIAGPTAYTSTGVWTATFSGFSVTGQDVNGKNVKLAYAGNQVIKNVLWQGTEATQGNVKMNVTITVDGGSTSIVLTNFVVDFTYNPSSKLTTLSLDGLYNASLKLSDFGVPATPGLPESLAIEFTVSTPTRLEFTETTDKGVYKLSSAQYTIEIDYTNDIGKFTVGGVTQQFPLGS